MHYLSVKMDAVIGMGGLNNAQEEFAHSKFDLFGETEYEIGVKKCISQTFRPLTTSSSDGPFSFLIPADPEKFTDAESCAYMEKCALEEEKPS